MSVIRVLAPGLFTTVQDLGRPGFGSLGVSASGAADPIALRLGNRLVGNPEGAAALEMTLLGGTFEFPEGAVIALGGSDFGAALGNAQVLPWLSLDVSPGQTLTLGPTRSGARCYLCVRGGIAVKPFLGSASTHLLSGLGGVEGRPLRKGDVLETGGIPGAAFRKRALVAEAQERLVPRKRLRVTRGPQYDAFAEVSRHAFYAHIYRVAEESNRMGLRLEGPPLLAESSGEMITEGVSLGAVQVPPGGRPIILFVEQQTTGGYPKIANVIAADLPSLGQLRPRDEVQFEPVTIDEARAVLAEQERWLASLELMEP